MKGKFIINRLGAQNTSPTYDTFLTKDILDDISTKIIGNSNYEVEWLEVRNKGRLIKFVTDTEEHFINLSQNGQVVGRNYQVQSIPTALAIYLKAKTKIEKKTSFWFYFLPFKGNNETKYMLFFYRIMKTIGIKFLNPQFGLKHTVLKEFATVKDMMFTRNSLRESNSGNQSTYITDEGEFYHIYGKTFGANQKETTLLCFAMSAITDKPIKLFQILDNDSKAISEQDKGAIEDYSKSNGKNNITILDDTYEFDGDCSDNVKDRLRSPKFIYNLLSKFGGEKKCALCGCTIERIVQAAHIYPVADIRKRKDIDLDHKIKLAIDGDNGIWLCENHHKLFDCGLIWFEEGKVCYSSDLSISDETYIKQVTIIDAIEPQYINDRMLAFFDSRAGLPPRITL